MNKKIFCLALCALVIALCSSAEAQQTKKVPLIGYLSASDAATASARAEGIRLALRERGYIEGQNIATEYRYGEGRLDRFAELAAELVRLKVDIIVVAGGAGRSKPLRMRSRRFPSLWWTLGSIPLRRA
jgi:putative ABC transport system substrate-binding protein